VPSDAITYGDDPAQLTIADLVSFFEGWRSLPLPTGAWRAITDGTPSGSTRAGDTTGSPAWSVKTSTPLDPGVNRWADRIEV